MIRAWTVIALALLLVPALPGTAQQTEPILLMDDEVGDVEVTSNGQSVPTTDQYDNLDITSVHALEQESTFTFQVGIVSDEPTFIFETGTVSLYFAHQAQEYRVRFDPVPWAALGQFLRNEAELERHDPTNDVWDFVAVFDSQLQDNTFTVDIPRSLLIDESGTAPYPGRALSGFRATSYGSMGINFDSGANGNVVRFIEARDHAEPEGEGLVLAVTKGFAQTGHVRLSSDEPTRASNGEATTFVYEVKARSLDGADDLVIEFSNVPPSWNVVASSSVVSVDGEGGSKFLVKVEIPFAHQHGVTERIMVEAQSLRDATAIGRMELGVHYLEIPQLSGHHNTLYIHSGAWGGFVDLDPANGVMYGRGEDVGSPFMNSLQEFAGNSGAAMTSDNLCTVCVGGDQLEYTWSIPLSPSLRMGIDMNMTQVGEFKFSFATGRPMPEAVASGHIIYKAPGQDAEFRFGAVEGLAIAELEPVLLGDLTALSVASYDGFVTPLEAGDYMDYERGAQVYLVLRLTSSLPPVSSGHGNPLLEQGGSIQLPLDEYADTVADLSGFITPPAENAELESFEDAPLQSKNTPTPALLLPLALALFLRRRR